MKTEPPIIDDAPLGNAHAPDLAGEPIMDAGKPVTRKRKASPNEENIAGETEEQKQKRARGRPRLDTKDETAADRRRTQIRLAQRAYRHRKDNAITNLEDKVKELEKNNADMSREFHRFHDLVLSKGLLDGSSEAISRLKAVTDRFLNLNGRNWGETGYISPADEHTTIADGFRGLAEMGSDSSAGVQSPQKSSTAEHSQHISSPGQAMSTDSVASYEIVAQATPDNASFPLYTALDVVPNLATFAPITSPYGTLPMTSSLAHHELTFGRRLQRRTTERGLFLASVPNPPPERYAAVFGFSLLFESREAIAQRLAQQLANMVMPLQDQANPQRGPFEEKMEQRIRLTFGFEKEFLNADEIEMYLQQLGIIIPHQVEYVDAEVDVNELVDTSPPLSAHGSFSSQSSGFDNLNAHLPVAMAMNMTSSHAMTQRSQMLPHEMQAHGAVPGAGLLPYMCPPGMENVWGATPWQKPKLTISVAALVEELASKSVCMGKHPGVRLKDVNKAIKAAAGLC
ncbi:bZIP transcription factor, putative [Cordyceps militaris CM01]|uniref:BZIP transcription factor, putative n=1 Tax=Cordyceps militaris (strain CM01) TaxID=983644 RepID=G3JCI5_CORMM|nr:bZIP transcription factor, putative [Cordyceps militaris CM01]EGX94646.1 bZIP transcription factor, putative [Cordyceps militaris CM01]